MQLVFAMQARLLCVHLPMRSGCRSCLSCETNPASMANICRHAVALILTLPLDSALVGESNNSIDVHDQKDTTL